MDIHPVLHQKPKQQMTSKYLKDLNNRILNHYKIARGGQEAQEQKAKVFDQRDATNQIDSTNTNQIKLKLNK